MTDPSASRTAVLRHETGGLPHEARHNTRSTETASPVCMTCASSWRQAPPVRERNLGNGFPQDILLIFCYKGTECLVDTAVRELRSFSETRSGVASSMVWTQLLLLPDDRARPCAVFRAAPSRECHDIEKLCRCSTSSPAFFLYTSHSGNFRSVLRYHSCRA